MVSFPYDEYAAAAPQWYKEVVKALSTDDVTTAKKLAEEALGKKRELASLLAMIAVHLESSSVLAAKPLADEAVEIAKGKDKAAALHYLAKVCYKEKNAEDAEKAASEALALYKGASNKLGEASILNTKALNSSSTEALELANEALAVFKEKKDLKGTASVLSTIIQLKLAEGKSSQALNVAEELVRLFADGPDLACALLYTAKIQMDLDMLQDALSKAQAAMDAVVKAGDAKMKASALLLVANIFGKAGMFDEAHKAATTSLNLCRDSKDKAGQAAALCMAATVSDLQQEFGQAAYKLEKAASIYKQLDDKKQEAQSLESVAQMQMKTFWSLDDSSEPALHCEKAMKIYTDLGEELSAAAGYCLQTYAFALIASKRNEEGLEKATDALSVFEESMDQVGEASALATLAQIYWDLKDKTKAKTFAEKSKKVADEAGDVDGVRFAKGLLDTYDPKKKQDSKEAAAGGMTDSSGAIIRSTWIGLYIWGKEHVLFDGFTVRGVREQPKKGPKSASSSKMLELEETAEVAKGSLTHSFDFQALAA